MTQQQELRYALARAMSEQDQAYKELVRVPEYQAYRDAERKVRQLERDQL